MIKCRPETSDDDYFAIVVPSTGRCFQWDGFPRELCSRKTGRPTAECRRKTRALRNRSIRAKRTFFDEFSPVKRPKTQSFAELSRRGVHTHEIPRSLRLDLTCVRVWRTFGPASIFGPRCHRATHTRVAVRSTRVGLAA